MTEAVAQTVTLPLGLANVLFDCYYGVGPRHHEKIVQSERPPVPPEPDRGDLAGLSIETPVNHYRPRGILEVEQRLRSEQEAQHGDRDNQPTEGRDAAGSDVEAALHP